MRLLDEVMQCRTDIEVNLPGTGRFKLPGPGVRAQALAATPLRYILSDSVRILCDQVRTQWPALLTPADQRIRIPAAGIWLEWWAPACALLRDAPRQQCGMLVSAEPSGRAGTIESFWHDPQFGVERAQVTIAFDFDRPASSWKGHAASFPIVAARGQPYADHARAIVDPGWRDYFSFTSMPRDGLADVVAQCLKRCWTDLPMLMAFLLLLSARAEIAEQPVDRAKLNAARLKRGKPALLDHIELAVTLGAAAKAAGARSGATRNQSRLHLVKGHLVQRRGTLFWRKAHLRGQRDMPPIVSRTFHASLARDLQDKMPL